MDDSLIWKMIDSYFNDNPQSLVRHHIESYNDFFKNGIFQIFKEKNPLELSTRFDKTINDYRSKCIMYFGGKTGNRIYFGKPVIYDDNNSHYMFPNEARLRNMSYGMTIHYDIEVEFIDILAAGEAPTVIGCENMENKEGDDTDEEDEPLDSTQRIKDHKNKTQKNEATEELSEEKKEKRRTSLKNHGGAPQPDARKRKIIKKKLNLTPAQNALLREATEKSMVEPNKQKRCIVLEKIYLGKFPIMVQSDFCVLKGLPKEIRHTMGECSNDIGGYFIIDGKEKTVVAQEKFADNMLYIRDVNDEHFLYSAEIRSVSENVSKPIRTLSVKIAAPSPTYSNKNIVVNIPNVRKPVPLFILFRALGIISDKQIITMCLLDIEKYESMVDLFIPSVHDAGAIMTQRNALNYIALLTKGKTIAHALEIMSDYFLPHIGETNYLQKAYYLGYFDTKINLNESLYANNLYSLVLDYYQEFFREKVVQVVDSGFRKAFKGNWGAQPHTKRIGIVQDLNRLSFNSALSHLRKTNLPLDATAKVVGPRVLHSTQWGFFDPIDTPDGGNIGLHKHLSISAYITQGVSREPMLQWLREKVDMKLLEDCSPKVLSTMTKVILNGLWAGAIIDPIETVEKIKLYRRNALIPIYTSVTFDIKKNTIFLYTDAGRLCRPIIYRDSETGKLSIENKKIIKRLEESDFKWSNLITGFNPKKIENFDPNQYKMYELSELYENIDSESNPAKLQRFLDDKAILDYIDTNECEDALIALNKEELKNDKKHTHLEIHESLILGVMCNLINFPENNPATRNSFSCGQSKQAVSMYHTNHQVRMDKTAVVLVSGQVPLVKSRYLEYINNEGNPYGENAIVAIMCYTGYNVEDAMLINEGSLKRGLFRTTYFSTYESHEEKTKTGDATVDKLFTNIENETNVIGTKPGFDYSKLDKDGLVRENTPIDDKTVLIGLTASSTIMKDIKMDMSKTPKKGQLGIVDKTFITDSEEGKRIAKVRVREVRIPNIGDKMACALPTQQVLTDNGWIEIKDIDINIHKVATLDKNGNMCYESPINKFEYDHNGKMYSVKNKQVELVCTLNHKLYIKKRYKETFELTEAENVVGKMVRFKKSMKNVFPDVENMIIGNKQYKMDDWLQLLGMFIGDGTVNNRAVILSCHKERKINFNISILQKLELEYKHDNYNGYIAINMGKYPEIYKELKQYIVGALNKYLPEYVWSLSQRQCIILLEALMQSDGHTYSDGFSRYGTISPKLANDISRLAVHCGWSGIIKVASEPDGKEHTATGTMGYNKGKTNVIVQKHTYYKISIIRKQNEPYINKKINDSNVEEIIDYDGKVYCVEMPSSNLYYMRENNFAPSMLIGNSRSGQKGTIGLVVPEQDMPFTKDGIRPDLIINPHALPSRMTIGQLVECIIGKAAAQYGGFSDCTAFINKGSKIGVFGELLPKVGFHSSGNEVLYNGMTGEQLEAEIFMGPNYYMRLKHMVKDKINYRALGPRTALTKQPVSGRANDGGLRIGEMERDSVISHGAVNFLTDSMMERGDKYYMAICNNTGMLAIYNPSKNIFMSPMADGPVKYIGSLDGKDMHIENVTKFGRSFSVVKIPYTLKLLIQELQTMNVQMRLITEENIQQIENMTYSKNIDKLMFKPDIKPDEIVTATKGALTGKKTDLSTPASIHEKSPEYQAPSNDDFRLPGEDDFRLPGEDDFRLPGEENFSPVSPPYVPTSPPYAPNESPQYNPSTPTNYYIESPPYPGQELESPPFAPALIAEVGQRVHYRGDTVPNRLWTIIKKGDNFITIKSLDAEEDIKVVRQNEIYEEDDYSYLESPPMQTGGMNQMPMMNMQEAPNYGEKYGGNDTPAIHFAPVIKVMNGGSDFSSDPNTTGGGTIGGVNMNQPIQNHMTQDHMMTGGASAIDTKPIIVKDGGSNTTPPVEQSGGGSIFDMGKLLIKKIGL